MVKQKSEHRTKAGEIKSKNLVRLEIGHKSNRIDGSFCTIKNRCGAVNKPTLIDSDLLAA